MRYLLDTNCWMQIARRRDQYAIIADFLRSVSARDVCITDYALHSLLNVAKRHGMLAELPTFIAACGFGAAVEVVSISPTELHRVTTASLSFGLDIDDAYQYVAAELHDLHLVSLDTDFDRTPRGRLAPAAALGHYQQSIGARTPPQP